MKELSHLEKHEQPGAAASLAIYDNYGELLFEFFLTYQRLDEIRRAEKEHQEAREQKKTEAKRENELIEEIASLEHEQWMSWSKWAVSPESLFRKRVVSWEYFRMPYGLLSEELKEANRVWARKVLKIVRDAERHWRGQEQKKKDDKK